MSLIEPNQLGKFAWNGEEFLKRMNDIWWLWIAANKSKFEFQIGLPLIPPLSIWVPRFEADSSARCDVGVFRAPHAKRHFCTKKIPRCFRCVGFLFHQIPRPRPLPPKSAMSASAPELETARICKFLLTEEIWLYRFGSKNWGKHPKNNLKKVHDSMMASGLTPIPSRPICWFVKRQARRAFFKKARVSWISSQHIEASFINMTGAAGPWWKTPARR